MLVRKWLVSSVAVVAVLGWGWRTAWAQHEEHGKTAEAKAEKCDPTGSAALPKCPVGGHAVDFYCSVMTDDGPVYFCCPDCIPKFKATPKDFAEKVAAQREGLKKLPRVQVTCPVGGEPIDKKISTEKGGSKTYFCCDKCKGKYEADPAAYKAKLAGSYTYQAKCPVTGEDIDPTAFSDLAGKQRVYWCCMACEKKLMEKPEEYAPKLAAQGYKLDVEKLKKAKPVEKAEKAEKGEKPDKP